MIYYKLTLLYCKDSFIFLALRVHFPLIPDTPGIEEGNIDICRRHLLSKTGNTDDGTNQPAVLSHGGKVRTNRTKNTGLEV